MMHLIHRITVFSAVAIALLCAVGAASAKPAAAAHPSPAAMVKLFTAAYKGYTASQRAGGAQAIDVIYPTCTAYSLAPPVAQASIDKDLAEAINSADTDFSGDAVDGYQHGYGAIGAELAHLGATSAGEKKANARRALVYLKKALAAHKNIGVEASKALDKYRAHECENGHDRFTQAVLGEFTPTATDDQNALQHLKCLVAAKFCDGANDN